MRSIAVYTLFLALTALASCDRTQEQPQPVEMRVSFAAGLQVSDPVQAFTRAAENVPADRTARVLVYLSEQGATGADFSRQLVAEKTYYFNASGDLVRCNVDAEGISSTGDVTNDEMSLPLFSKTDPGYFDIYVISPALPINPLDHSVTVTNNMDFMVTSLIGYNIPESSITGTWPGTNASPLVISLPAMKRLCSAISIQDLYNDNSMKMTLGGTSTNPPLPGVNATTGRYHGISIDNLCAKGKYVLGNPEITVDRTAANVEHVVYMLPKANDDPATTLFPLTNPYQASALKTNRLGSCDQTRPNSVYSRDLYVLPYAADNAVARNKFVMHFSLTISNTSTFASVMTPALDGTDLVPGWRNRYNIQIYYTGASATDAIINSKVTVGDPIKPWVEFDPENDNDVTEEYI